MDSSVQDNPAAATPAATNSFSHRCPAAIRMVPMGRSGTSGADTLGKNGNKKSRDTAPLNYMCFRLPGDAGGRRRELLRTHGS